ncbi:MAG: efflux RND transporter periplasmic adaptor subunit, partial [Lentisphaerae bacterium]
MSEVNRRKPAWLIAVLTLLVSLPAGMLIGRYLFSAAPAKGQASATKEAKKTQWWTCSMHPQIKLPKPGKCPICHMDLIPMQGGDHQGESVIPKLELSPAAAALAEVEVAPVEERYVRKTLRLSGRIDFDETRVKTIAAWVNGRIERMFVDFTGTSVRKGDHMFELYSPDLYAAEEELLQAYRAWQKVRAKGDELQVRERKRAYLAVREKLRLWGLGPAQIDAIVQQGKTSDRVVINAPQGGIVITKMRVEGDYVKAGTPIYRIADLSRVWGILDAYEEDLPWLHLGQPVTVRTSYVPGIDFKARVAFIDPVVDAISRTIHVRVVIDNPRLQLRPGMFTDARIHVAIGRGGQIVTSNELVKPWLCPMHPWEQSDKRETCKICGMALVSRESLGFHVAKDIGKAVAVPVTAVLPTGKRAVVYVRTAPGTYEGREVVLGPRGDDYYIVRSGVKAGELVVVNGNFKIDSALQIAAKPSMMTPHDATRPVPSSKPVGGTAGPGFRVPPAFIDKLRPLYRLYFQIQQALGKD